MIRFHDPRGETAVDVTPYALSTEVDGGKTIGFLANGFPDSERFLQLVAAELKRLTGAEDEHWNKGNASIPAPDTMLQALTQRCHAAVAAYGH